VIVTYASPQGRRVVLADANPAIIALRTSTLLSLEETLNAVAAGGAHPEAADTASPPGEPDAALVPETGPGAPSSDEPPPNLGPPPERLDWRKPR
jgi:hypothetical protein